MRKSLMLPFCRALCAAALALLATATLAATVTINPLKDNTIYQGTDPTSGEVFEDNSCGAGPEMFSGTTADGFRRRALLQFDIANAVPAGSTINSVTLTTTINRSGDNQDATMTLHPLTRLWGEGTVDCSGIRGGGQGAPANTGDATWLDAQHTIISWTSAGGDFGAASASAVVPSSNGGNGIWDSTAPGNAAMAADVQGWLDGGAANNGWVIVGDETRSSTSRRFWTREGNAPPTLTIDFTPTGDVFACCFTDGACTVTDTTSCTDQGGTPDTNVSSCDPNPCPQPVGACCNADESCGDPIDRATCEAAGGVFQGSGSTCSDNQVDCGLAPFVDPLPVPPVLPQTGTRADGAPQYNVEVVDASQQLHSELPDTDVWTYNGAYPAATIEVQKGQPVEVTYVNNLPPARNRGAHLFEVDECAHGPNYWADSARIVTHLHGGHVPARFDGQPEYTILPGELDVYEYPNNQDAATLWYHDHALGITRLNVYAGMAGFYLVRDEYDTGAPPQPGDPTALNLPTGEYEIPMVIQDREFNSDGSLFYNPTLQNAFKGDKILVNGKVWPFLDVKQGKYRFRLLNGSQSREYTLRLENLADPTQLIPFTVIGTDTGLTTAPINVDTLASFAPAERMDVIVDFSGLPAGTEVVLRNDDGATPMVPNVMKFVVTSEVGFTDPVPATLRPVAPLDPTGAPTRYFRLTRITAPCSNDPTRVIGEWLIESLDGAGGTVTGMHWDDITEFPTLGTREVWEFENPTNSMHPMHVHLVRFQVLSKETLAGDPIPLEPWEIDTWKDTVRVPPQSRVRVVMDFEDYLGKFPYHCHILDHEDHEMMRQFQVANDPADCNGNGVCETGEDCVSCPGDCAQVSGALCGNGLCEAGDGENCATCPEDCAGKQKGNANNQYCCGFDDGQVTNPIGCGVDVNDERCIDSTSRLFCRTPARVLACCGDAMCEGQETESTCAVDCGTAEPPVCTYAEPTLALAPASREITTDGGSVDYTLSVANNDSPACPDATFDLAVSDSDNGNAFVVPSTLSQGSVTLPAGGATDVVLTVTAQPGASNGATNDSSVTATDPASNHGPATSNTVTTTINVGAAVDCSQYTNRNDCRNEPTKSCRWDNQAGVCINR